jgi:ferredoxin-NADP reductase
MTPLRALLEDLPEWVATTVIVRASTTQEIVHRDEIASLVALRGGRLHELIGSRYEIPFDSRLLRQLVPDVARCDVYVCGPEGFSKRVIAAARRLGVRGDRLHHEAFSF